MRASRKPSFSKISLAASMRRSRVRAPFEERALIGFSITGASGGVAGVSRIAARFLAMRTVLLDESRIGWWWHREPSERTLNHRGALGVEAEHAGDRRGFGQRLLVRPCHI